MQRTTTSTTSTDGRTARVGRLTAVGIALGVAVLTTAVVWATGAVISDDFRVSQAATGVALTAMFVAAVLVARRRRDLAVPVLGTFVVVAGALSAWLLYTSTFGSTATGPVATGTTVSSGEFVADAHPTKGEARIIRTDAGSRAVVLDGFETDPGPDLRVYFVPGGDDADVKGAVDLGPLRGSSGDQSYDLPASVPEGNGAVVVWCRAFSVSFGHAVVG